MEEEIHVAAATLPLLFIHLGTNVKCYASRQVRTQMTTGPSSSRWPGLITPRTITKEMCVCIHITYTVAERTKSTQGIAQHCLDKGTMTHTSRVGSWMDAAFLFIATRESRNVGPCQQNFLVGGWGPHSPSNYTVIIIIVVGFSSRVPPRQQKRGK